MRIQFYEDPTQQPRSPDDVRFNKVGLYVYPDKRRIAVGFDLTPFLKRPSLEVRIRNERGDPAATLSVIEALQPNFSLTVHLRDSEPTERYDVEAVVYYSEQDEEPQSRRKVVDIRKGTLDVSDPGEYIL